MAQENENLKDLEAVEELSDFDDDNDNELPELEEDLIDEQDKFENQVEENEQENLPVEEIKEEQQQNETEEVAELNDEVVEKQEELSLWEELDENNSVVKKYIFYISKDFVPYIDNLSADKRSAYINDAIQIKIDLENEKKHKEKKIKLITHFVVMILTFCLMAPFVLFGVHKAIMATFDNYKYSQENFEKLYKQRFAKDRAYMRSVEYNNQIKQKNVKSH